MRLAAVLECIQVRLLLTRLSLGSATLVGTVDVWDLSCSFCGSGAFVRMLLLLFKVLLGAGECVLILVGAAHTYEPSSLTLFTSLLLRRLPHHAGFGCSTTPCDMLCNSLVRSLRRR